MIMYLLFAIYPKSHSPNFIPFADDTYMYDDAARGALGRPHQGHWYDEPPYESDPDDFLMSGINLGPAAKIQVCYIAFIIIILRNVYLYKLCVIE